MADGGADSVGAFVLAFTDNVREVVHVIGVIPNSAFHTVDPQAAIQRVIAFMPNQRVLANQTRKAVVLRIAADRVGHPVAGACKRVEVKHQVFD